MRDFKCRDARLKTAERNKRKLVFNEKGKFESIANKLRAQAKLTLLQKEIAKVSRKTGISSESKLALIQPKKVTVGITKIDSLTFPTKI